jgi:thymidylate synthase (FAD)
VETAHGLPISFEGIVMKIVKPSVELISITPDAEKLIERAGRTCYKSEDKIIGGSAAKFIKMILERGHESVIEHASASFKIVSDRGVLNEVVRHRIASYSQTSTRYVNYSNGKFNKEISVIEPPGLSQCYDPRFHGCIRTDLSCCPWHSWSASVQRAEDSYMQMIDQGMSPQIARSVLPLCLASELIMTANMREWRHFIKLRTSKAAHPQMIEIATMIRDKLIEVAPSVFGDLA